MAVSIFFSIYFAISFLAYGTMAAMSTHYHADLGEYGTFEMEIAADDRSMNWKVSLQQVDQLAQELGVEIPTLNYHLHQQWTLIDGDYAIGGTGCGSNITGGHYDPFFGCGPATGVPADQCLAMGKSPSNYTCSPELYETGLYSECEVGDLSAKFGSILVQDDGTASTVIGIDPYPALKGQYEGGRTPTTSANVFASVVFHNGSPRVLCGKLVEGKLPSTDTTTTGSSSSRERFVSNNIFIQIIGTMHIVLTMILWWT